MQIALLFQTTGGKLTKSLPVEAMDDGSLKQHRLFITGPKSGIQFLIDTNAWRLYQWSFVVADVSKPIIGADFLDFYNFLPDIRHRRLIYGKTQLSSSGIIAKCDLVTLATVAKTNIYYELLTRFKSLTRPHLPGSIPKSKIVHQIFTTGPPIAESPRRLSPEKLRVAKAEFQYMMEQGWCRPSHSPWASQQFFGIDQLLPKV